jgi:hypothetical protein
MEHCGRLLGENRMKLIILACIFVSYSDRRGSGATSECRGVERGDVAGQLLARPRPDPVAPEILDHTGEGT